MRTNIAATIALLLVSEAAAVAQLAWWGDYLPRTGKPPVILVTGHDAICPSAQSGELPFYQLTFGDLDKVLARDGRVSLVFEACYAPNRPPIEELGNLLGRMLEPLRYRDGEPVRELDVIAHSMGGLIVRAYLAGKQRNGAFSPPVAPRIRKAVFLGTPHFGTSVARSTDGDPQVVEMALGSRFLFDLATWHQGTDDLRGIDAIAIAGTGGRTGPATDSVVTVGSASIDFAAPGRTIAIPYCHTQGGIGQLFLCNGTPGLARVFGEDHPTAQLVLSFLNDRDEWRLAAASTSARATPDSSAIAVTRRTAGDRPEVIGTATLTYDDGSRVNLSISTDGLAFSEMLRAGPAWLDVDGIRQRIVLPPRSARAFIVKPGPRIESVEPASGQAVALVLAPGMLVAVNGVELSSGVLTTGGKPARIVAGSSGRLLPELPEGVQGLVETTIRSSSGEHTVRVLIEPAAPSVWKTDSVVHSATGVAVSAAEPVVSGEIVSVFLTGLGATVQRDGLSYALVQPVVTVDGRSCDVLYAGRAPGLAGVDQINLRLPFGLAASRAARLSIASGSRTASVDIPVR